MNGKNDGPFSDAELAKAIAIPLTDEILFRALRTGTRALSEFGHSVMEPVSGTQLHLTEREAAIGLTFYRLLGAMRTPGDLDKPYHFQAVSGQTRLVFELCIDLQLFAKNAIASDLEGFHTFTRAARFSTAFKTVRFYKEHPELEDEGDCEERRGLVNRPGLKAEIEELCQRLWGRPKAPEHWSGLRWSQQLKYLEPAVQELYAQWSDMHAWNIHGGAASVGGLSPRSLRAMELISRDTIKRVVPEAYRLVAVEMHTHRAVPGFFETLDAVKHKVEVYAVVEEKLRSVGHVFSLKT